MATVAGRNLIISVGGVAIAGAKSCEVQVTCEEIGVSSPTQGRWHVYLAGRKGWSVNVSHLVGNVSSNVSMVGTTVELSFYVRGSSDRVSGTALVQTWKSTGIVGNLSTGTFQFLGSGALS